MYIIKNSELPIQDNEEALEKFKELIKNEFEREVDLILKENAFTKDNLLIGKNVKQYNPFIDFFRKYAIYQIIMNSEVEDLKKYNLLGVLIHDFPLDAINVFVDSGHALNRLAANVNISTPFDSKHALSTYISPIELCLFGDKIRENNSMKNKFNDEV